jgi:arsenical pump membrane protein
LSERTGRRPTALDGISFALLVAGAIALATGALPASTAHATANRIRPLLIFLCAVIVLAELASRAELFDVIAVRITILAGGRNVALFAFCFAFAALTTIFLNLDTTAVLLTPVMLATARRSGIAPVPLAMTTVWLANTASLLLPVSNLTNLLAAGRVGLSPVGFATRMALPQAAALIVVAAGLWIFYWRRNDPRYQPPAPMRPHDRRTFTAAAVLSVMFIGAVLIGISITVAAAVCAAGMVIASAVWNRAALHWSLLPWRLLVFVTGLFLVMDTLTAHGLGTVMGRLIGTDPGTAGVLRAAGTGAGTSNLVNNLPAYVAGEAVIPTANHDQLIGLLLGTNVGALITPWAALATLLWAGRCRAAGLAIPWRRYVVTSAVTAIVALSASVAVLLVS